MNYKTPICVYNNDWDGVVVFDINAEISAPNETLATCYRRIKTEWQKDRVVWSVELSPRVVEKLAKTKDHMRKAATAGESYSWGAMSKVEAKNAAKKALREFFGRGNTEFLD